ncbi:Xaa-Pro aminopeptidase family enzyme [Indibacter alkaliphilus LW1]|uniref:Xaa-Pro aminopeptidase family enzyme n=1 Tax=Indibacter alkaliphilus (strain CCUG 57479 / KCTC 22604 / LW1) TaxID=1189612 RepID=S2DUD7_INDAL|nr:M24 family metallopeptidase [Indibacter alkaliphilus]EOZ95691.1 Xaa-Pro aminopeptidase family enzyme [Indibacter alkaliphilus LW1]
MRVIPFSLKSGIILLLSAIILASCQNQEKAQSSIDNPFDGPSPWPEIRKERLERLLPHAMKEAEVDAWIVICRENNNDPIAHHIGGENAGGTAMFLFYLEGDKAISKVFSPVGEATALGELKIHDEVIPVERGKSAILQGAEYIKSQNFNKIAINSSFDELLADGLSYTQRKTLEEALGNQAGKLVSAEELIYEFLAVKLPAEVEIMTKAAELTAQWQEAAYAQVIPGKTTDADVAKFLKKKMEEYGVKDGWSPDQNPSVNSGPDRGHSHPTDKVIMPGDVIQTDFGIRVYDMWVSDIQRFAYVLREGETQAPDSVQFYFESSIGGNRIALAAMKPGVLGYQVDKAQRDWMDERGSEYVMWSTGHPVGYVAHDIGPNLGAGNLPDPSVRPAAMKPLKEGMLFAFDGFHAWKLPEGGTKTMSVEETAVVTSDGARYLIKPQEELILIK